MMRSTGARSYPRTARLGALLREVVAEELERVADKDERLGLVTVTAVETDPELRHATVLLASAPAEMVEVLEEHRHRLQKAIARQARLKRTPLLSFKADPAIEAGRKVEETLRKLRSTNGSVSGGQRAGDDDDTDS